MSEQKVVSSGGIRFSSLLGVLFIGLKLGGVIDWDWWWVLSPLWIPWALLLAALAIGCVFMLVCWAIIAICEALPRKRFK
jgi:hypothetical protein